jgi:hypothetical protein
MKLITAAVRVDCVYGADPIEVQSGSEPMLQAGVAFFDNTNLRGQHFCVACEDLAAVWQAATKSRHCDQRRASRRGPAPLLALLTRYSSHEPTD